MSEQDQGNITHAMLQSFQTSFEANPAHRLAMNAVTRGNLQEIAINREVLNKIDFMFSDEIETGEINDQKRSGTCWLYAELNWLRTFTQKKIKVKSISFSENYILFWDKLEKANYFLERIIELHDRELDDRWLRHILNEPVSDGGEWHMIVNLIKKYGLIPRTAMPDTTNRENTRYMNEMLSYKLREGAARIYHAHREGKNEEYLRKIKAEVMDIVYRILVICMGKPPKTIDFCYRDEDKKYHRDLSLTPHDFFEKYVGVNLDEVYVLWSCPATATPFYKTFTIEYFDNMTGGDNWSCLNVPIEEMKKIAVKMLKKKDACLFGCDVLQHSHSKEGILYTDVYNYDLIFQTKFVLDKGARMDFSQSRMTHSMVFTGVDLTRNQPHKWKVENSWGDAVGKKGYFIMSDEWFDEHVFDMVAHKSYLSKKQLALFEQKPIMLPPWYPMT